MIAGERRVLLPRRCVVDPVPAGARAGIRSLGGTTMGTDWRVTLVETARPMDLGALRQRIEVLFTDIIAAMSTWDESSEISRFNRAPAGTVQTLSGAFCAVLEAAMRIAGETDGCFDPTIGPAVRAWGFGADGADGAGGSSAWQPRWRELRFDPSARKVRQPGGAGLDLSAIAKGYAVDRLAAVLRAAGIASFLAEIGGELVGRGAKPNGEPWWVLLETPPGDAGRIVPTVLALHDLAVATSGDYRRFRDVDEGRISHLLDPRTGRPAATAIAAVSVVHETCMEADALATALAVMDAESAFAFAEQRDITVRFVLRSEGGLVERLSTPMQRMAG